jgi:hypothetical protein
LRASLRKLGHEIPTMHTIQLLDASISGSAPAWKVNGGSRRRGKKG